MTGPAITILYFAWLRERIGLGEEQITLPVGIDRVDRLITFLTKLDTGHAHAFERPEVIRCAVNQTFAGPTAPVQPGDEVAFFPPVTGG